MHRLIAKAILYRKTERIVTEQAFGGYRANTVAYTIAFLSWLTNQRIDLDLIWRTQDLSTSLEEMIRLVCNEVREVLVQIQPSSERFWDVTTDYVLAVD